MRRNCLSYNDLPLIKRQSHDRVTSTKTVLVPILCHRRWNWRRL